MNFEFLIPLSIFGSFFGIAYMYLKTRNSERLAMIEKGIDLSALESIKETKDKANQKGMTLKIGMLFIGVALGILLGTLLDEYTVLNEEAYFGMIFLMGGIALVLNDFIEKKRAKELKE